jgi:hypothetical protein
MERLRWTPNIYVAGGLACALVCVSVSVRAEAPVAGQVVSVTGKVLARDEAKAGGRTLELKSGTEVREGDVVNTPSNGTVKFLLADKTIIDLGPSALFKFEKFKVNNGGDRQVDLAMTYGTVRASISQPIGPKGKFVFRTKTATMGVRGTELVLQTAMGDLKQLANAVKAMDAGRSPPPADHKDKKGDDHDSTKVTVIQGRVDVEQPKNKKRGPAGVKQAAIVLTAGSQLTTGGAASGAAPVVTTLSAAELKSVTSTVKIEDNTFKSQITVATGGSGGGESAIGAATAAAISKAVEASVGSTSTVTNTGFAGTVNVTDALKPVPVVVVPAGGLHSHTVTVVITR